MTTPSKTRDGARSPGRPAGARGADAEDLLRRLRRAPTRELRELVEENSRHFTLRELRQTLLNPYVDGDVLQALGTHRTLMGTPGAKAAVARHRRTPEPLAMRLIPHLFWRDLAEITLDLRIRASVRRVAERYLLQRLPRLAEGEKINLARRSVDTVAARLLGEAQPRVVDAGLENPRLSEKALLDVVTADRSPPRLLDRIAKHPRWGARYEVQAALCQNARAPYGFILEHLGRMRPDVLERVAANVDHADFLRRTARELLADRAQVTTIRLESASETLSLSIRTATGGSASRSPAVPTQHDGEHPDDMPGSDGGVVPVDV
ncbi:MAG: hypothetical protein AAGF23_06580 [Acidobacteriota bacterium]